MELGFPAVREAFYPASTFNHNWFVAKVQSNISRQVAVKRQFKYEFWEMSNTAMK
jgi:hypothetical protein